MRLLVCVMLVGTVSAYYRYYDERNLVQRHEPSTDEDRAIKEREEYIKNGFVPCPVCARAPWMPNVEECPVVGESGRTYKKCKWGTFFNEKCGNRPDCFQGPNEPCTEKREYDDIGKRCMPGYTCSKQTGKCEGVTTDVDSTLPNLIFVSAVTGNKPTYHRTMFKLTDPTSETTKL